MTHLEKNNILSNLQHGFRKRRSCETQLLLTITDLAEGLNRGASIDAVLLDFSKAFDKVPHERLILKMSHCGLDEQVVTWVKGFLTDRTQRVILEGETSDQTFVTSGVPQGTVLGPALFLIYINDLPEAVNSHARLCADDCLLYREVKTLADHTILQQDLDALQKWEDDWLMAFNPSKCEVIHITKKKSPVQHTYTIHKEPLKTVENAKYLGLNINKNLSWNHHINTITKKANSTLGFLRRNISKCSPKIKKQAYTTFVRPTLEYAAPVWGTPQKGNTVKIEAVQRRAARFI